MDQQPNTDKETLAADIDAIALIGHAVGELSRLRREQTNESASHSHLLFGADLAKQMRDANKCWRDTLFPPLQFPLW